LSIPSREVDFYTQPYLSRMFIVENLKPFTLMFYKEKRKRQKKMDFQLSTQFVFSFCRWLV